MNLIFCVQPTEHNTHRFPKTELSVKGIRAKYDKCCNRPLGSLVGIPGNDPEGQHDWDQPWQETGPPLSATVPSSLTYFHE
jgi:hypothetical protein